MSAELISNQGLQTEEKAAAPLGEGTSLPNSPVRLGAGMFWLCAFIGAFMPMLPVYLTDLGVSASGFAFLFAIQGLTAVLVAQFMGYVADTRLKRTDLLMAMSLFTCIMAYIFPKLPANLFWLSLGMVGMSLTATQRLGIFNALTLDSTGGEERYSRLRMMGTIGFVIVTPCVGWLADRPVLGPNIMWPCIVAIELILVLTMMSLTDDPAHVRQRASGAGLTFRKAQRLLLGNKLIFRYLVFIFLLQVVGGPGHLFQLMLLKNLGEGAFFATMAVTWAAICEIFTFWWGSKILGRVSIIRLLLLIPFALAIRYGMIFLWPVPWVIFASNTLHFITFGLSYLCGVIFMNQEVPRKLKSSGQAIYGLMFSTLSGLTGYLVTSGILEFIRQRWHLSDAESLTWWFGGATVFLVFALMAYFPLEREYSRRYGRHARAA